MSNDLWKVLAIPVVLGLAACGSKNAVRDLGDSRTDALPMVADGAATGGSGGTPGGGGTVSGDGGGVSSGGTTGGSGGTTAGSGGTTGGSGGFGTGGASAGGTSSDAGRFDLVPDLSIGRDVAVNLDVAVSPSCPRTPPANDETCTVDATRCLYDSCPASGRTQAICSSGKWAVATGACGLATCQGSGMSWRSCPSGQVCVVMAGGALLVNCAVNSCGSGPLSSECQPGVVGCTLSFTLSSGATYYCNTCPQDTCS